jgi:hypothetical protein
MRSAPHTVGAQLCCTRAGSARMILANPGTLCMLLCTIEGPSGSRTVVGCWSGRRYLPHPRERSWSVRRGRTKRSPGLIFALRLYIYYVVQFEVDSIVNVSMATRAVGRRESSAQEDSREFFSFDCGHVSRGSALVGAAPASARRGISSTYILFVRGMLSKPVGECCKARSSPAVCWLRVLTESAAACARCLRAARPKALIEPRSCVLFGLSCCRVGAADCSMCSQTERGHTNRCSQRANSRAAD